MWYTGAAALERGHKDLVAIFHAGEPIRAH